MPTGYNYSCSDCGAETEITIKGFHLGPTLPDFASHQKYTQSFICDSCKSSLTIPREIDDEDWKTWKTKNENSIFPYTRYDFLASLVSEIDHRLKHYPNETILLSPIKCPYCAELFSPEGEFTPPACRDCGGTGLKLIGTGIASMKITWPPIPKAET